MIDTVQWPCLSRQVPAWVHTRFSLRSARAGMDEVYRARDTKLNRDVAIKVLSDLFAGDPEWLARFEREAQLLASLNHPNIAQIYGFEESSSTGPGRTAVRALVMELVDGPTLADRIAKGAIPLEEALPLSLRRLRGSGRG